MREREEIQELLVGVPTTVEVLQVELLLDIRDLLTDIRDKTLDVHVVNSHQIRNT